ncbi:1423_t:CDS:2 [Acaulospora morrowiae]|uniref:1423_t:CDS:1 n=1 Tax=Acaulospora morrowiae TaxID=94023 RepID=A0A9N9HAP3_9GLOM|nr:1423_t:CDS:2 [Acaulospora morrowiae]
MTLSPIFENMKKKLQSISDDRNNLARVHPKVLSIHTLFNKTIKSPRFRKCFKRWVKKMIENIDDKIAVAPDTRPTEELDKDDSESDETDYDDELSDGE